MIHSILLNAQNQAIQFFNTWWCQYVALNDVTTGLQF